MLGYGHHLENHKTVNYTQSKSEKKVLIQLNTI